MTTKEDNEEFELLFRTRVNAYLHTYGPRKLADYFEVSESTCYRWSRGVSKPHPRFGKLVLEFIDREGGGE